MTPEQTALLSYTVEHFKAIARQNRFPENNTIAHEVSRCVICHPELLPMDPFAIYLEVVAESVKVRRPRLDQDLVQEINNDLVLMGLPPEVSEASLLAGEELPVQHWSEWIRTALTTGLELLSIHSATAHEFSLEKAEAQGWGSLVEATVKGIMDYQKRSC